MKTIELGEGYRIEVVENRVKGYEPRWDNEAISLWGYTIQSCRTLPIDINQSKRLLELYLRCIEEYEKLQAKG